MPLFVTIVGSRDPCRCPAVPYAGHCELKARAVALDAWDYEDDVPVAVWCLEAGAKPYTVYEHRPEGKPRRHR